MAEHARRHNEHDEKAAQLQEKIDQNCDETQSELEQAQIPYQQLIGHARDSILATFTQMQNKQHKYDAGLKLPNTRIELPNGMFFQRHRVRDPQTDTVTCTFTYGDQNETHTIHTPAKQDVWYYAKNGEDRQGSVMHHVINEKQMHAENHLCRMEEFFEK